MDIGCTPFLLHGLVYLVQHLCILVSISVKLRDDWKIFDCGWKIRWEISRSQVYLPAFIVFTVRVLRRFWEIWQIFSRAELLCV